ncbi:MAG: hypothetical protein ACRDOK_02250 [Streptosporangiaceae bacterium]
MTGFRIRHPASVAAGLAVGPAMGGAAYGGWVASSAGQQDSRQVSAVEAAFSHAVQADQSFGSPPAAYQASVTAAIRAHRQAFAIPAAEHRQLLAAGTAAIARYFSSAQASAEQTHLNDGLALDSDPNIINLGSGVSQVRFLHVTVTGARATVEADVTVWAKSEARQATAGPWLMTDPVNIVDDKASLALRRSGTWQVTSLPGSFVPGYGL